MVRHTSKSTLVVCMKSKLHINYLLMELKEIVISKANVSFSVGEDTVLRNLEGLCVPEGINHGRDLLLLKFHLPGCHKDVLRLTTNIILEWYEK